MPKKLEDCVKKVAPKKGKSSAYAICTSAGQKAGWMPKKKKGRK